MQTLTKRKKQVNEILGEKKSYTPKEAVSKIKEVTTRVKTKFDETVEVSIRLGVDPKQSNEQVRGAVVLPGGTGKKTKIVVIARGEKVTDAEEAGADIVGGEELISKISGGWLDFDKLVTIPEMMPLLAKLGKILGPKGLMPNPKDGTVTTDLQKAIKELKKGKVSFRAEKDSGIVHVPIGKASFTEDDLLKNFQAVLEGINKSRPSGAKGTYIRSIFVTSTMGPSLKVDPNSLDELHEYH